MWKSTRLKKHFFECRTCADEVESGVLFQENARAAFPPVPQPATSAHRNWLSQWLSPWWARPAFAAPALAAGLLCGGGRLPSRFCDSRIAAGTRARPVAPGASFLFVEIGYPRQEGGKEKPFLIPAGAPAFLVQMDLDDTSFPQYESALYDKSGAFRWSVDAPAPPPGGQLNVVIPVAGLRPGVYTLKVHGIRGSQVGPETSYSIPLQFK